MTLAAKQNSDAMQQLLEIVEKLRSPESGCSWDKRQTWQSLFPYTLEEVYEVGAAIDASNPSELCDELGDLLFQVIFYSQIAKEQNQFEFNTVAEAISNKMVRRHPHVFTDKKYNNESEQKADWEAIKQQERQQKQEKIKEGYFSDILQSQPALMRSVKLKRRASQFGFDWHEWQPVVDKVREELDEVVESLALDEGHERIEEEIGDLLLSVANLAHQLKVDPENALRKANNKFERRVDRLRDILEIENKPGNHSTDELDQAWQQVKAEEKQSL